MMIHQEGATSCCLATHAVKAARWSPLPELPFPLEVATLS